MYISKYEMQYIIKFYMLNETITKEKNKKTYNSLMCEIRKVLNTLLKHGIEIGFDDAEEQYYIHPALF